MVQTVTPHISRNWKPLWLGSSCIFWDHDILNIHKTVEVYLGAKWKTESIFLYRTCFVLICQTIYHLLVSKHIVVSVSKISDLKHLIYSWSHCENNNPDICSRKPFAIKVTALLLNHALQDQWKWKTCENLYIVQSQTFLLVIIANPDGTIFPSWFPAMWQWNTKLKE